MTRQTKIVATLGPASSDPQILARMVQAGVDVVRMNFSHGKAEDHIARAEAIRGFASAVASGAPLLELAASSQQAVDRLTALDGVGDWTAQYIALRALKEPDAFPAGDLGLRRALPALAPGGEQHPLPTAAALRRRAEGWRPWRGYAAMLLWQSDLPGPPRQRERN